MTVLRETMTIALEWLLPGGQQAFNVLHARRELLGDITTADCEAMGTQIAEWYDGIPWAPGAELDFKSYINENAELVSVTCKDSAPGPSVEFVTTVGLIGATVGDPLPNETCIVTTLRTDLPGRSGRGRVFQPAASASQMGADGRLDPAVIPFLEATWQALIDHSIDVVELPLCVLSSIGPATHPIVSVTAQPVFHHQRRRNT